MIEWTPITVIGSAEPIGTHPRDPAYVHWEVALSARPEPEWIESFRSNRAGRQGQVFECGGDRVRFHARIEQVDDHIKTATQRIEAANHFYSGEVLPIRHARAAAAADDANRRMKAMDDARRYAERKRMEQGGTGA